MMWIEKPKITELSQGQSKQTWRVFHRDAFMFVLEIGQVYESNSGALYKLAEVSYEANNVKVVRIDRQHNESYVWHIHSLINVNMKLCEETQTTREFPLHT